MFRVCSRINNFNAYVFYHNPVNNGSLYDRLRDSMTRVQSVDDKEIFFFVDDTNDHHSEWLESVSHTYRHGRRTLDFCNMSGCEQFVRCLTQIAGNRLDLVMTDAPDIVDVFVGTPLGTSNHCFVSYVLHPIKNSFDFFRGLGEV